MRSGLVADHIFATVEQPYGRRNLAGKEADRLPVQVRRGRRYWRNETVLKVSIMGCDLHALPWQVLPTRRCRQRRRHTVIDGRSRT